MLVFCCYRCRALLCRTDGRAGGVFLYFYFSRTMCARTSHLIFSRTCTYIKQNIENAQRHASPSRMQKSDGSLLTVVLDIPLMSSFLLPCVVHTLCFVAAVIVSANTAFVVVALRGLVLCMIVSEQYRPWVWGRRTSGTFIYHQCLAVVFLCAALWTPDHLLLTTTTTVVPPFVKLTRAAWIMHTVETLYVNTRPFPSVATSPTAIFYAALALVFSVGARAPWTTYATCAVRLMFLFSAVRSA